MRGKRKAKIATKKTKTNRGVSLYVHNNENNEFESFNLNDHARLQTLIGLKGGIINPIVRDKDFIVKILSLPAYQQTQNPMLSKENLPSIQFSRDEYKKAWKIAIQNFNINENNNK